MRILVKLDCQEGEVQTTIEMTEEQYLFLVDLSHSLKIRAGEYAPTLTTQRILTRKEKKIFLEQIEQSQIMVDGRIVGVKILPIILGKPDEHNPKKRKLEKIVHSLEYRERPSTTQEENNIDK